MQNKTNRGHGGARAGAGRKKGSVARVTLEGILSSVHAATGRDYLDLLAEDFVHARNNDRNLAQKYHHLIMNKVAPSLQHIETVAGEDAVEQRAQAFAEALRALTQVNTKAK